MNEHDDIDDLDEELVKLLDDDAGSGGYEIVAPAHGDESPSEEDPEDEDIPRGPAMAVVWTTAALVWAGVAFLKLGKEPLPPGPAAAVVSAEPDESTLPPPPAQNGKPVSDTTEPVAEPEAPDPVVSKIKIFSGPGGRHYDPEYTKGLKLPAKVTYKVKRGGSIKFIANLYKIFHHEIQAWNPGKALDQELAPGTRVTVFKAGSGHKSESIGSAVRGRLEGGVPMVDGPGRTLKHTPWKGWATGETVATLDRALRAWSERSPAVQSVLVGNMSSRQGGRLKPHGSHQSGRDIDLGYIQKGPDTKDLNWREMTATNLDAGETWRLLETLVATGGVEAIYIDSKLQKILYDHAVDTALVSKRDLAKWMEYPRPPGSGKPIVQHVRGHVDHLHVRFACPKTHTRCESSR